MVRVRARARVRVSADVVTAAVKISPV